MQTIEYKGKTFSFIEEVLDDATNTAISIKDAKEILHATKQLFEEKGINIYLTFGTLLGAIREKSIIKGDEDVDVMCMDEDALFNILDYLEENQLHLIRAVKGSVYSFRLNSNAYIDVYIIRPLNRSIWKYSCCALSNYTTPKRFFKKFVEIEFLGEIFKIPANPERLLEFWYGKNWRTPEHGHNFKYEIVSAYYWHKMRPYIKRLLGKS